MTSFEKLIEILRQFPGIGPRQASRFGYFLLTRDLSFLRNFAELLVSIKEEVKECSSCRRFFARNGLKISECEICRDKNRDQSSLLVVGRDLDLEMLEKSGAYKGRYFVLGGVVPILEKEPAKRVRGQELFSLVEKNGKAGLLKEIILALNATPEGEHTADYIREILASVVKKYGIEISVLGKGLSTGTELEYADSDTLKNALKHREKS